MKRKFFSTLLMGAFFIASLSTVTSCKDYDDDINANSTEIQSLKTTVANLQSALDQAKADATAALANYATKTELATTNTNVSTVQNSVTALQDAVAKLVTADQLQKTLDEATETMNAALAGKASVEDLQKVSSDVTAINEQLDAIGTWKETVDAAIETANTNIKNQQTALDALKTALEGKASADDITALKNQLSGKASTTQLADLATTVNAKADTATVNALARKVAAIEQAGYDLEELGKTFATVSSLNDLKKEMQKLNDELDKKVGAQINILSVLINKRLSSLVFKPSYMINGIEAEVLPALVNPINYVFDKKAKTYATEAEKPSKTTTGAGIYPEYEVSYHFNPSTADLTGYAVSFYNNEPVNVTRAEGVNTNLKPAVDAIDNTYKTNGIVKIPVANNEETWKALSEVEAAGKLPMIALQAAKGDTVVTSDYGYIKPVNYSNLVLADNTKRNQYYCTLDEKSEHLTKSISWLKSLSNNKEYCHEIKYDARNVDLKEFIDTHVTLQDADSNIYEIEVTDSMLEKFGLSYKFQAIDYTIGNEETSQSVHLKVTEDGLATPQEVNSKGEVVGDNTKKGAVGRLPIVRVTLEDKDGNIYQYGYIKVVIVEDVAEDKNVEVTVDKAIYANCDEASASLTWAEVEAQILNELDMSHNTFLSTYNGWYGDQYVKNDADGTFTTVAEHNNAIIAEIQKAQNAGSTTLTSAAAAAAEFYAQGGVGYVEVSEPSVADGKTTSASSFTYASNKWGDVTPNWTYGDSRTTLLTWTFNSQDFATLAKIEGFVDAETGLSLKPVETYIRFSSSNNTAGDLYVKVSLPKGAMHFAAGTLGKHIAGKWYATASNAEGDNEIHANVAVPTTSPSTGSVTTFTYDILTTFQSGKVAVDYADSKIKNEFSNFDNYAAGYGFYFNADKYNTDCEGEIKTPKNIVTGASGAKYEVYAKKDAEGSYTSLHAVKANAKGKYITTDNDQEIASIKGSVITYNNGDEDTYAKDILNYAPHTNLSDTFVAYIKMLNSSDVCYDPFINGSDEFAVRFLRPINAKEGEGATATDAVDGGSNIDVMNLIKLDDWRDYGITYTDKVDGSKAMHSDYITYYGIKVTFDPSKARTDEDLSDAERTALAGSDVASIEKLGTIAEIDPNMILTPKGETTFTPTYDSKNKKWTAQNLNYKNNTTTARKFHIYLPITVEYNFGKIATFYGVITVNKTQQNAKKN